jgi:transcriptional regulator
VDDPDWLRTLLEELTAGQEAAFARPWAVGDAPESYLRSMLAAVVGIELAITRVVGKWKVSQNQPAANRAGVESGLRQRGDLPDAAAMADLVAGRRPL